MKNFVIVVDTQYDFMMPDGILYVSGAEDTIVPIIRYLASLKPETTAGVLFTHDTHIREEYEGSPESEQFPIHCELGTVGNGNIISQSVINPQIEIFDIQKGVFDMWRSDSLVYGTYEDWDSLDDMFGEGFYEETNVTVIDIIGVALNFCVKQATDGFLKRGFTVRLHTSMTRGIDTGKPGDLDARVLYADEIAEGKVIVID